MIDLKREIERFDLPRSGPSHDQVNINILMNGLQEIRDISLYYANKYRWDPVIGKMHGEYLNLLNKLLKHVAE